MNLGYEIKVIRDAAILTNSYVSTDIRGLNDNLDLSDRNQVELYVDFTIWSLTSLDMIVEFWSCWTEYYQETSMEINWGIWTINLFERQFTESWKFRISFPIKDKFMRIRVKWTGTVTSSSLQITSVTWQV